MLTTIDWFTVGWYDPETEEWYFAGEYENYQWACSCARNTVKFKNRRTRLTNHKTGRVEYFEIPMKEANNEV